MRWNALRTIHGRMLETAECTLICVSPPHCQDGSAFLCQNLKRYTQGEARYERPGVTPQHRSGPQNSTFRNDNVKGSPLDAFMMHVLSIKQASARRTRNVQGHLTNGVQ
ncbi:hypothetical protein PISMIDRAFT_672870 [Pisolithus microcarpus 441]|uniref:Uncharacterized protein n=1 Tax=Pisolithus microcarpus 441 TaxID=765257 RepID=A0A0D0A2N5_9AGAM|nr:hypothetical protein PISMIDRAFT_672870 [Pisolithus microcarpus 441]